jgi:branched-chain amino acid aminotransferase
MEIPFTPAEINAACIDLIARQDIVDGYLRPVAWRGSEMMGVSAQAAKTHVAIATWPWPNLFGDDRLETGIRMKTSKWRRPSPDTAPVKAKAAGLYMICTLSRHSVEPEGYDDALMLDWRGQVAESTGANIFLVQNGVIHTPTPDCFLDGITRRTVMDLARKRGYEVIERVIMPEDLADADEVFLTGTAAEVTPVGEIDEHNYQVGPITRQLMDDYETEVRKGD